MSDQSAIYLLGTVISALIGGNALQWREIKRLNQLRLNDMREIGLESAKTTRAFTQTANKLLNKLDGGRRKT